MATKKRKILVTGSAGTVGSYISSLFPNDQLFLTTKQEFDITNKKNVLQKLHDLQPHIVIHLAAKTNVDDCEKNEKQAHAVNALGTKYIALGCHQINATLIYVSTGAVFGGTNKNGYTEHDEPDPVNIYGKTKLLGEKFIQEICYKYIIIRAGWIIGGGKKEKKFLSYLLQQIEDGKKEIQVVNDKFGTITSAKELVQFMQQLLTDNVYGVYHFASTGICSRYELAQHALTLLHIHVKLIPVSSTMFVNKFSAPRPHHEVINSIKFPPSFFNHWQKSLTEYVIDELT